MAMKRTYKTILAATAVGIAAALACRCVFHRAVQPDPGTPAQFRSPLRSFMTPKSAFCDPLGDEYVRELRKYYGADISRKATQAALACIRDRLAAASPADGRALFAKIIGRAFPDKAKEILETLNKLDIYNRWLEENRRMLLAMPPEQRLAVLWRKRTELLGDDAKEIWSGEMLATDARMAKVRDTLQVLDEAADTPMDDNWNSTRGPQADIHKHPGAFIPTEEMLSKIFFSIESVQPSSHGWTPGTARRRSTGYVRGWLLGARDRGHGPKGRGQGLKWETGLRYMEEREDLERSLSGPSSRKGLRTSGKVLRRRASTIELGEGRVLRFKRPAHLWKELTRREGAPHEEQGDLTFGARIRTLSSRRTWAWRSSQNGPATRRAHQPGGGGHGRTPWALVLQLGRAFKVAIEQFRPTPTRRRPRGAPGATKSARILCLHGAEQARSEQHLRATASPGSAHRSQGGGIPPRGRGVHYVLEGSLAIQVGHN
jgi:hypothetical protein